MLLCSLPFGYGAGRDQPIPAGIWEKPEIPSRNTHAVKTNGPVRAGNPHIPKNLCRAGITITEHATVAKMAIMNDCGVSGTKLVRAIITSTWLNPCNPNLISAVGNFVRIAKAAPIADPIRAINPAKNRGENSFHWDVYPFVNHGLACPAIRGASSNERVRPTTQKIPVFQFSTKVTWDTPFRVAIMNSFAVHLKPSLGAGLPLFGIISSFGGGGGAGQMSCPYLLLAYIMAQVVKIKDDVNPGIAHEAFVPFNTKRSPIR